MNCPNCNTHIPDDLVRSEGARLNGMADLYSDVKSGIFTFSCEGQTYDARLIRFGDTKPARYVIEQLSACEYKGPGYEWVPGNENHLRAFAAKYKVDPEFARYPIVCLGDHPHMLAKDGLIIPLNVTGTTYFEGGEFGARFLIVRDA